MKIKAKLSLGIGLLFLLISGLSLVSIIRLYSLDSDTKNILKDNYNTLDYATNMLVALDNYEKDEKSAQMFEEYLYQQNQNITERGEAELTESLNSHFLKLKDNPSDSIIFKTVRNDLLQIISVNLKAIEKKSAVAVTSSAQSIIWIIILSAFCVVISLVLLLRLPQNISKPVEILTESIIQIADNNYAQRVDFINHDEFGQLAVSFNTMAEKLDEYNKSNINKLITEKRITETLINKIHDPIIGFDKNLRVNFANDSFINLSGIDKEKLIDKNATAIAINSDFINRILEMNFSEAFEVKKNSNNQIIIENNSDVAYYENEIQTITLENQPEGSSHLMGYVVILRNITKFKELDLAKTNFIATLSHELKTPISSLKLSLQLLENEKTGIINDAQRDLINSGVDDANNLLAIIGELLNLAQVESGKIDVKLRPTPVSPMIDYAISANRLMAVQKNIHVRVSYSNDNLFIVADSEKTAWVLTNILSNALRYSPENSDVFITVLENMGKCKISITDMGPGIAKEYKDKVFNRFFRVPGIKEEGTGLGLSISKEFIYAQNGEILLESELSKGSTFIVVLNLA